MTSNPIEEHQIANDASNCFADSQIDTAPGEHSVYKRLAFSRKVNKQKQKQKEVDN
jgi:hypothetical protein